MLSPVALPGNPETLMGSRSLFPLADPSGRGETYGPPGCPSRLFSTISIEVVAILSTDPRTYPLGIHIVWDLRASVRLCRRERVPKQRSVRGEVEVEGVSRDPHRPRDKQPNKYPE